MQKQSTITGKISSGNDYSILKTGFIFKVNVNYVILSKCQRKICYIWNLWRLLWKLNHSADRNKKDDLSNNVTHNWNHLSFRNFVIHLILLKSGSSLIISHSGQKIGQNIYPRNLMTNCINNCRCWCCCWQLASTP